MATTFLEPGGDATGTLDLLGPSGSPSIVTDIVHGGHTRSIKFATGSSNDVGKDGLVADAGGRISVWMYINVLPNATASFMDVLQSGFGSGILAYRLTSSGVIQLFSSGVQLGSNGPTLSTGQWYRISVAYTITNTTTYTANLWVNGGSQMSVSNTGTLAGTGTGAVIWGNISGNATFDSRFSDFYTDNSSALTDPGNIWVTAKRPFSNGTTNNFTETGTGSGYGTGNAVAVNERPVSTASFVSITPTTVMTEEYSIEGASAGDIDISSATIVDFMGWMDAKVASTSNSPVMKIIVAGTSTTKTLTTSNAFYTQIAGSTTYPGGGTDIGMSAQYTTTGHLVTLNECGVIVAYVPSSAVSASVTQVAASVTATGGTQSTDIGVAQSAATVTASGGAQSVATVQDAGIAQAGAAVTATGGIQATAGTAVGSVAQSAASVTASGGAPTLYANSPPSVVLNSPADTATGISDNAALQFTGTDPDGDTIVYEVQVDTVNTFDSQSGSPLLDRVSSTDVGFSL